MFGAGVDGGVRPLLVSRDSVSVRTERRVRQRDAVLAVARQNQLVDLVAQRHAVAHLGGVNTHLEDLDTLLQIDQVNLRRRVIQHQRAAFGGVHQDLGHLFAVGFARCRHG